MLYFIINSSDNFKEIIDSENPKKLPIRLWRYEYW